MTTDLIPAIDTIGLPGPAWLFHFLVVLTFFLHTIFVNLTLGGTLLAAISHIAGGGRATDSRTTLAGRLMAVNTYGISLTITTGVAPLLFVQVLYQQYFYSATILLGWLWFGFLLMLAVGYYAVYAYKLGGASREEGSGGAWLILSALLFLLVAVIHVAVHLIQVQPELWAGYSESPCLVFTDPTFFPRLFHFVLAGLGFSALVIAWSCTRRVGLGEDVHLNGRMARYAWRWVLWTTALQVADGFVLLLVLPRPVLLELMRGGAPTMVPLTLAIVGGIGLLMMLSRVTDPIKRSATVTATLWAMVLVVAIMTVTRHQVRAVYLAPSRAVDQLTFAPQWANAALFGVLLIAGLAVVVYMVHRVLSSPATGEDAA